MTMTVSNSTGDGKMDNLIQVNIELPDSGTTLLIKGIVQPIGGSPTTVTGSPLTIPATPLEGAKAIYIVQVNLSTGAASIKESATETPAPDAGNVVVLTQTLEHTSSDPAITAEKTPDTY
jgi:hypothetical protein